MSCDQGQFHPVDPDGYGADCRALTLCIYNSFGWGRAGEDSIGLYFETADLRTAVARGRDSYYGWFCSNLWHCGHITHIIQGFTLPLITRRKWPNTGPPYEANHFQGPATEQLADNGNPFNLLSETDWLSFCDSWKAHNSDIIVYSLFLLDLLAGAQFIPGSAMWADNLFEGWRKGKL